jgi:hypothetical protein
VRAYAVWFLGLIALAVPGRAAVVTYTNHALWQAAASGITTIDFAGLTASGVATNYSATGVTVSGVHFSDTSWLYVADDTYTSPLYLGCVVACLQGFPDSGGGILATLPAGTRAVGMFGFQYGLSTVTLTAQLSSGEFITQALPSQTSAFFGFTSTSDISSVTLKSVFNPSDNVNNQYPTIRQFEFGTGVVQSAPEPSTAPILAGAMLTAGIALRKKRTRP